MVAIKIIQNESLHATYRIEITLQEKKKKIMLNKVKPSYKNLLDCFGYVQYLNKHLIIVEIVLKIHTHTKLRHTIECT